jgi:hypothetical protein
MARVESNRLDWRLSSLYGVFHNRLIRSYSSYLCKVMGTTLGKSSSNLICINFGVKRGSISRPILSKNGKSSWDYLETLLDFPVAYEVILRYDWDGYNKTTKPSGFWRPQSSLAVKMIRPLTETGVSSCSLGLVSVRRDSQRGNATTNAHDE